MIPPWARGVCEGVHAAGSRHVVYVPDNPLSHVLKCLGDDFTDIRTTLATREEEAFGIAAGLSTLAFAWFSGWKGYGWATPVFIALLVSAAAFALASLGNAGRSRSI